MVEYAEESIVAWLKYYNKLVDKEVVATAWMNDQANTPEQKEAEFLRYKTEILEPLGRYAEFFEKLGIHVEPLQKVRIE